MLGGAQVALGYTSRSSQDSDIGGTFASNAKPRDGCCRIPGSGWRFDSLGGKFFKEADGVRWYRTGDLGVRRGGLILFKGRRDAQVKVCVDKGLPVFNYM